MKTFIVYIRVGLLLLAMGSSVVTPAVAAVDPAPFNAESIFQEANAAFRIFDSLARNKDTSGEALEVAALNYAKSMGRCVGRALVAHEELVEQGASVQELEQHILVVMGGLLINAKNLNALSTNSVPAWVVTRLYDEEELSEVKRIRSTMFSFFAVSGAGLFLTKTALENGHVEWSGAMFASVGIAQFAVLARNMWKQMQFTKIKKERIGRFSVEKVRPAFMEGLKEEYSFSGSHDDLYSAVFTRACELNLLAKPTVAHND